MCVCSGWFGSECEWAWHQRLRTAALHRCWGLTRQVRQTDECKADLLHTQLFYSMTLDHTQCVWHVIFSVCSTCGADVCVCVCVSGVWSICWGMMLIRLSGIKTDTTLFTTLHLTATESVWSWSVNTHTQKKTHSYTNTHIHKIKHTQKNQVCFVFDSYSRVECFADCQWNTIRSGEFTHIQRICPLLPSSGHVS